MCELCQSYCHYGPCYPRRCCSCSAAAAPTRHSCSSECCCRHCCLTCANCCGDHFRSHSVCGVFPSRNTCDECELRARRLTGHYLKMKSTNILDLLKTNSQSQNALKSDNEIFCCSPRRLSRRDLYINEFNRTPGCTAKLLAALQERFQHVDYEFAEDYEGIPFTYYPKSLYAHQNQPSSMYKNYLDELKSRMFSFKRKSLAPCKLFDDKFLMEWNKLYAMVGGGVEQRPTAKTKLPQLSKLSQPTPAEAMHEYCAYFGKSHGSSRRSWYKIRSSPYRHRRPPRKARRSDDSMRKSDPIDCLLNYECASGRQHEDNRENKERNNKMESMKSGYVFKYPTHLEPEQRARLSIMSQERHTLFGSLLARPSRNMKQQALGFENFERQHTIDLRANPSCSHNGGKFMRM